MANETFTRIDPLGVLAESFARLRGVRARLRAELGKRSPRLLEREALLGAHFRPGDQVRDKETGELYDVVSVRFKHVLTPPPERQGD